MKKMLTLYLFTIPLALSAQKNIETTERISLEGKVKTRHRNRRKKTDQFADRIAMLCAADKAPGRRWERLAANHYEAGTVNNLFRRQCGWQTVETDHVFLFFIFFQPI